MRFTTNPACILSLALSLIFPVHGNSQPSQSKNVEGLRIRFEGDFEQLGRSTFWGGAANMAYEMVRSHQVPSVQWTYKWLDGNQTPAIPRTITFDLYEINDFATCASLEPLAYVDYTSDAGRNDFSPKLFDASRFDHELVRGHCVAAKQAKEAAASPKVRMGGIGKIVIVTGAREEDFRSDDHYKPLAALDINLAASGHDLWSRDGMTRSLDPLNDAELVRAINTGGPPRLASLRILQNRHQERFTTEACSLAHSVLLKPTGPDVVHAILDSKILSEGDSQLRLQTMRALAAIRPATGHAELAEQLLSGLERPIEDLRSPAELKWQRSVEAVIGKEAAAKPEGQKSYRDYPHFEVAAGAALLSGPDVIEPLAAHLEDYLRGQIRRSLNFQPCTNELVANASYGPDVIMELIKQVDAERSAIPVIQSRIQSMAAIAAKNSPLLKAMITERCGRAEGFLPNGSQFQASAFCRVSTK